jgi:tRNA 5-methylaminomethyl-2-thiouridine biosynthesis bifunctional protein
MPENESTRARPLPDPGLTWLAGDVPASKRFGDSYSSRDGALGQARHVFLDGCGLPEAWANRAIFTLCELGFGIGLNFLATTETWKRTHRPGARLHYIAVEGYPLTPSELTTCHARAVPPELGGLSRQLLRIYPQPQPGFHRLFLPEDVILTVLFGDVQNMLAQLEARVDAWYLDGFAPERNPGMWADKVFAEVARLSHSGARLATYSAASDVRRGLAEAGFEVQKTAGFGGKREMLRARFKEPPRPSSLQPWFAHAPARPRGHAAVIGGGIAGASIADTLHRRGWRTTLIERRAALADEASGNPSAVIMPRLTAAPNQDGRFYATAWRFALDRLAACDVPVSGNGVMQLATDAEESARQGLIAASRQLPEDMLRQVSADEASDIAGCDLPFTALYFPQGGTIAPRAFCAALTAQANTLMSADIGTLHYDGVWRILDKSGATRCEADIVVLANARDAMTFAQAQWLPLKARRGQISLAPPTAASAVLRSVVTYGGYITPVEDGVHSIGATFDWVDETSRIASTPASDADNARNLAELARVLPGLLSTASTAVGRAALRCTTLDHLPFAGPLPDYARVTLDFAELRHGHPWARYPDASYQPGLYALTGLGARGMVAAPLAAEILASQICGEPWPAPRDIVTALHPARFIVRDLKRGKV